MAAVAGPVAVASPKGAEAMDGGAPARPRMPKVELHVHLDGAFCPALLFEATRGSFADELPEFVNSAWDGRRIDIREPVRHCRSPEDLFKLMTCHGQRSLRACIQCFEVLTPMVRGRLELVERLAKRFAEGQASQGVVYTEVRYAPHLLASGGCMSAPETVRSEEAAAVVDAVTRGLRAGVDGTGVTVNQILCGIAWCPGWADDTVTIASERMADWPCAVVGYDIAAGEAHFDDPAKHAPHVQAAVRAGKLGLGVTVHAGEDGPPANVMTAIDVYGAQRIGHGYRLVQSPEMLQEAIRRGVHFEGCPTSSLETGAWELDGDPDWRLHPMRRLLEAGASVSINSDDPTVFGTSLDRELAIAREDMALTPEQLRGCTLAAIDAAFAPSEEKRRLRDLVERSAP